MKYLLMMNTMKAGAAGFEGFQKKDIHAHMAHMIGLYKELRDAGELVLAEGLSFPNEAKLVRAGKESKEFLAGFWIVDVDTPERAYAIAAKASAAPGMNGAPMNMPIEVRPIMSGPPPEFL
jgi:hypothetical protein